MPGLGGEVLKSYGTNVVLLPGPDVVPAITSGTIDKTNGLDLLQTLEKDYIKYVNIITILVWHEPGTCLEAFINLEA